MKPNKFMLRKTQRLLYQLVTAPEGVAKALKGQDSPLPIEGDERLSATERLDIYANMYFFRIKDSLREDFPKILNRVGEDHFHNLVTAYLTRYPPTHWSLRYAGKYFPFFLESASLIKKWPYLSDLAKFEWAILEAFDAAHCAVLTKEKLIKQGANQIQKMILCLVPSLVLLESPWPVNKIYTGTFSLNLSKKTKFYFIVWRQSLKVLYRESDPIEFKLLQAILKGVSFEKVCEVAATRKPLDKATKLIMGYLNRWLSEGLLQDS